MGGFKIGGKIVMEKKLTEILPFEEWKSKLVIEPGYEAHNAQICYYNVDGRTMFTETTIFPHFGMVMASALCPEKYNANPKTHYSMTYVDQKGEYCYINDEETYEPTGNTVTENIDGLVNIDCYYYLAVLIFDDYEKACAFAYELYLRRRRFELEIDEE